MKKYGMPYMGSKSRIADKIIDFLPSAENFYDLFMGGGAMTHCAALSGKYKNVVGNDVNPLVTQTFKNAVDGKYEDEKRWISREDFFNLKDTDGYVAICWSFGNDMRSYLYGRKIEPYKKALHYAVVYGDYGLMNVLGIYPPGIDEDDTYKRYLILKTWLKQNGFGRKHRKPDEICRLQSLESLQNLRDQKLNGLRGRNICVDANDYRNVKIKPNSVIYCDIPYKNTHRYRSGKFDYAAFYNWCGEQTEQVFISGLEMPEDRFECVWETPLIHTICATNNACRRTEKIFIPRRTR